MRWLRVGLIAVLVSVAAWYGQRTLTLEDDPIRSLADNRTVEASLFERFLTQSPYKGKLFVEFSGLSDNERQGVDAAIAEAGYVPAGAPGAASTPPARLVDLAPAILPLVTVETALAATAIADRARAIELMASLPGATALLGTLAQDPLGLARHVSSAGSRVFDSSHGPGGAAIRIYESPRVLSYEKVGHLYDRLVRSADRVRAISDDFFALANYRTIRRDFVVCTAISLPLNFALFWIFVRRADFLVFLFVGSLVSYAAGVLALAVCEASVFTLALVFTSTFVSFNNEYLVHLCGLDPARSSTNRLSLGSAIGTTFIGFLALLFARAAIVRQMALVSIGGMAGFLIFLFLFRDVLADIHLRIWRWPMLSVGRRSLLAGSIAVAGLVAAAGMPALRTRVETFGVMNDFLRREADYFGGKAGRNGGETVVAVEAGDDPAAAWQALATAAGTGLGPHPLTILQPVEEQTRTVQFLNAHYHEAVESLRKHLESDGIRLAAAPRLSPFEILGEQDFLRRTADLGPAPTWIEDAGRRWLVVGLREADADRAEQRIAGINRKVVVLSPKAHFNRLLTGMSRQVMELFVAGLIAISVYLIALQRRWDRLLYIVLPLALSLVAFLGWLQSRQYYELNFIHLTGFALVLAVAVDYSSIAVSSGFGSLERTKILVTGLSTLASFGTLIVARHPALHDLGVTVTVGCAVSLAFALFIRLNETS